MPTLAVFAFVLLVNVCVFRLVLSFMRRRSAPPRFARDARVERRLAPAVPDAPPAAVVSAPAPVARAFPVHGLPAGRDTAAALEGMLRRLSGVTTAYVSPVTALVYLDYLPAQVTEEELVQAIGRQGYRAAHPVHRFDWRHAQHG